MNDELDIKRLRLLENAIMNYSCGIVSLEERVLSMLGEEQLLSHTTKSLLEDIAIYFRDIKFFIKIDD
jgi:hypothetical protein